MKELNYPKVFMLLAGLSLATLAVYRVVSLRTDTFLIFALELLSGLDSLFILHGRLRPG